MDTVETVSFTIKNYVVLFSKRFLPVFIITLILFFIPQVTTWFGLSFQFSWWMKALLLCFDIIFLLRALVIFPWERSGIKKIEKHLATCDYYSTDVMLKHIHSFYGTPAKIKWGKLKIHRAITKNDLLEEYNEIYMLKKRALLKNEKRLVALSEAQFLYRAGDYRDFKVLLASIKKEDLISEDEKLYYANLCAFCSELDENYTAAKATLENVISESSEKTQESQLVPYLNLAVFETRGENFAEAETLFLKALEILRAHPKPCHYNEVFHNLVFIMIKNNKISEAVKLLNEYRTLVDRHNPYQLMELANEWLIVARQTGVLNFLYIAYAIIGAEVRPLLKREEWLIEFVSSIRTMTNDPVDNSINFYKADLLFNDLCAMTFPENFYAMKELYFSLLSLPPERLNEFSVLQDRTIHALLELRPQVEEYLQHVPVQILELRFEWLMELSWLYKITPSKPYDYNDAFFEGLFSKLAELARLSEDKQNEILQIKALIFLCDDFANYALDLDERFRSRFGTRAKEALRQASSLVEKHLTNPV